MLLLLLSDCSCLDANNGKIRVKVHGYNLQNFEANKSLNKENTQKV
jgi:hypothetical protein